MISTVHDATTVNKGRKDRKTNMEIKKPYAVVKYHKFIKDTDRADQHLTYYSVLKKTVKWSKKVVLYLLNCVLFSMQFLCTGCQIQSRRTSCVSQEGPGNQKSRIEVSQVLMTFNCQRRGPKPNPPGRLSGDIRIHKLKKTVGVGMRKKKYPARQCKVCAAHKK